MYCTNCGNELPQGAKVCGHCNQPTPYFPPPPDVPNYLVHSIVMTVCCCLPFGIVALVNAAQVNSKLAAGNVAGAEMSSRKAKTWCIVALITGIVSDAGMAALLWQ